jgi:hypothetical protein
MESALPEEIPAKDGGKRKAPAGPTVSIGDVTVSGGITKQAALETVRNRQSDIEACFAGYVTIPASYVATLTINPDGTVKEVKIKTKARTNGSLEKRIITVMKQLKFASTQDGKESTISISLLVRP